jgi:hypothetical protein
MFSFIFTNITSHPHRRRGSTRGPGLWEHEEQSVCLYGCDAISHRISMTSGDAGHELGRIWGFHSTDFSESIECVTTAEEVPGFRTRANSDFRD